MEAEGSIGEVKRIGLLYTEILSIEQKTHFIPNTIMASRRIINFSKNNTRKIDTTFSISYESDIELAKTIILRVLNTDERVFKDPEPLVRLKNLGTSSLDITVRAVVSTGLYMDVLYDLNETLLKEFQKAGIRFAYQRMDVRVFDKHNNM